jgi:hypothetical protein
MPKTTDPDKPEALKRIGGGRWETRDGRFQIEPQSGTWVIVDTTQTNEFGLPLVRGPFGSLTAAKDAIEAAREEGPVTSPLAGRLEGGTTAEPAPASALTTREATTRHDAARAGDRPDERDEPEPQSEAPEPKPAPEPLWLRSLKPVGRQKARDLIEKLTALGIDDAEAIAREEIAEGHPALARYALAQHIREATKGKRSVESAAEAIVDVMVSGEDEELGVGWGLVDDRSRPIDNIDLDT